MRTFLKRKEHLLEILQVEEEVKEGFKVLKMAEDAEYMFGKTAGVVLNLDDNESDKIRFMLPNGHLYKYKLVNIMQQIQINEKIRSYTNGKKWIEWSMLGIKNVKDVVQRFEEYRDEFQNTFFNKMKIGEHIKDIEILGNEIIFNLDGSRMKKLNLEWEYKIVNELMQYCVLHNFEIVIVNKKRIKQNNNKKNNNKTSTDRQHKDKNANTYQNIQIKRLDYVLDEWDKEIDIIDKVSRKRQHEICNVMNEEFGILSDIVDGFKNKLDLLNEMKQGIDMELLLKLNERNNKVENTFVLDLSTIENKLELEKVNLLHQEIKMKEGGVTEENLDKQAIDLKTQTRKEKDRTDAINKSIKTCENTLLIMSHYDQEIQTIKLDQLNDDWLKLNERFKSYDSSIFTTGERSLKNLTKEKSGLTLQQQKMKIKNVENDNKLISTSTPGIVGDLIFGIDIRKININSKIVVSGGNGSNVNRGEIDRNLFNLGTSGGYNTKSIIIPTRSVAGIYDNTIRQVNNNGDNNGCEKICEIDGTLLNFALFKIINGIDSIVLDFHHMNKNVQGYYDYG